jgi:Raf kinase inhibitor-like YbhB/YbcL family protein
MAPVPAQNCGPGLQPGAIEGLLSLSGAPRGDVMKKLRLGVMLASVLVSLQNVRAAQDYLDLSSPDFKDGGHLAQKYGGNNPHNPNCAGQNVSPALEWKNPPTGTKSFAIILFDTAGRAPLGVVHWFAYGIPPTKMGFKEGEAAQPPEGFMGGNSTMNLPSYFGPCPPKGVKAHPYVFTLMAYDIGPDAIPAGLSPADFVKSVQSAGGKLLESVSLVSRYGH